MSKQTIRDVADKLAAIMVLGIQKDVAVDDTRETIAELIYYKFTTESHDND